MAAEGVLATLAAGWEAMRGLDVPTAVIGGLAMSVWNHARYTRDADLLVAIDARRVDELVATLVAAGFRPRHAPPLRTIDGQGIIQFMHQPAEALLPYQFDVLLAGTRFQRESLERAVARPLPSGQTSVRVVRPDDLIVIKLLAGRIIDRADAAMLLRENRADIDFYRLHRIIAAEGLGPVYREIWRDALPDASPPDCK